MNKDYIETILYEIDLESNLLLTYVKELNKYFTSEYVLEIKNHVLRIIELQEFLEEELK